MLAEERRSKILGALKSRGVLSVNDACALLDVSRMTVHRDLEMLSAAGLLRKVHGGAVTLSNGTDDESARHFTERKPANAAAKARIAQHLAPILARARNLALDASSTVFEICHTLPAAREGQNVFVITNGIPHFEALRERGAGYRVAITGGELHPRTGSLVGPLAVKSLEGLRFDFAVVSCAGLMQDTGQVYDSTPEGAAMKLAFVSRATKKVLAVDKSKLNLIAPYPLGELTDFDLLVTEEGVKELKRRRK
ncbi:MAG TPA: DeoR/GlpR family DNA-binding transcription regulator [Planctomycetota bacterium]|nr:DeoR/GlpR family DNA-binding transcription regulator [Planctomycetota bacterium]